MPAVGKEIERPLTSIETNAPVEQMGYVEKIEKQTETSSQTNTPVQPQQTVQPPVGDMGKVVAAQFAVQIKPNIILPMDQQDVVEGLHRKVWDSVRWLSEWCIMMIKKYPGRVFYLPPEAK